MATYSFCGRFFVWSLLASCGNTLLATDFFLTIGGGYNPSGNQASLEANVVFFQQVLKERHHGAMHHDIFFADGDDDKADLQVIAEKKTKKDLPASDVLAALHRRRGPQQLEYRNHRVPNTSGLLDPAVIRRSIESTGKNARPGDRLIVYVTAHGSQGPKDKPFNTTIDCWNDKKISAREFTRWLNELPSTMPVIMVMAQCYCGGFSHTIFEDLDEGKGLAIQPRVGFFAQQYNLPAAGCRPDIENDEEFSSYFWGAIVGRSRNGLAVEGSDIDKNSVVSFAEAYAHAVIAGNTIDIPLRTSDVLLKTYSRLKIEEPQRASIQVTDEPSRDKEGDDPTDEQKPAPEPPALSGTLQSFVNRGRPVSARIVTQLGKSLGFTLEDDATRVVAGYDELRRNPRNQGRGQRRRPGSGRRELLQEVTEKWPELGDERHWEESALLKPDNQEQLLNEIKELPSWKAYEQRLKQIEASGQSALQELREVKFRRLINTLEAILLEQNLPRVAKPEIVERYRQMIALEESAMDSTGSK